MEAALESLPDIRAVTVTTESVKDQVAGSLITTYGSQYVIPYEDLSLQFEVGDWVRLGHNNTGPVFTIADRATVSHNQVW